MRVTMCVVNEFWELSSLYDSCNWPKDSCYYILQQGNTPCKCVSVVFIDRQNGHMLSSCVLGFNYEKTDDDLNGRHLANDPFWLII